MPRLLAFLETNLGQFIIGQSLVALSIAGLIVRYGAWK